MKNVNKWIKLSNKEINKLQNCFAEKSQYNLLSCYEQFYNKIISKNDAVNDIDILKNNIDVLHTTSASYDKMKPYEIIGDKCYIAIIQYKNKTHNIYNMSYKNISLNFIYEQPIMYIRKCDYQHLINYINIEFLKEKEKTNKIINKNKYIVDTFKNLILKNKSTFESIDKKFINDNLKNYRYLLCYLNETIGVDNINDLLNNMNTFNKLTIILCQFDCGLKFDIINNFVQFKFMKNFNNKDIIFKCFDKFKDLIKLDDENIYFNIKLNINKQNINELNTFFNSFINLIKTCC